MCSHCITFIISVIFFIFMLVVSPQAEADPFIIVDHDTQTLSLEGDVETLLTMRVVLGKKGHETPLFDGREVYLTHIITNPTWTVPRSIAVNELLPEIKQNGWYGDGWTLLYNGREVDASTVDFNAYTKKTFPFVIRQEPGHRNALGYVKFMLSNAGSIFLHDTQARSLFKRDNRFFSPGCIRLEKPIQLANMFGVEVDKNGTKQKWYKLNTPIRVYFVK